MTKQQITIKATWKSYFTRGAIQRDTFTVFGTKSVKKAIDETERELINHYHAYDIKVSI